MQGKGIVFQGSVAAEECRVVRLLDCHQIECSGTARFTFTSFGKEVLDEHLGSGAKRVSAYATKALAGRYMACYPCIIPLCDYSVIIL
jgi:hypothetical protein